MLLVSGLVSVPKPLSQIQRSTRWLLQGLSPRPSFGGFGLSNAVKGTRFEGVAQAASWVWAGTGNFFLDCNYDDGAYDGFSDPWDDEVIAEATEEWRRARAVIDSVYQLADWLEEDLSAQFAEMLDFILGRLGIKNQYTEENDHE